MIKFSATEDEEKNAKRDRCIDYLRRHIVDVGLTSSASARSKFLMAIHDRGSPIMHIPPRPVIRPTLNSEEVRSEMGEHMRHACEAAFDGDINEVTSEMEAAGQAGADGIRARIDRGVPPPNAPITLTGGWIYNRVARKGVLVKAKQGDKPLKDTGQLYNDFDYEIREV